MLLAPVNLIYLEFTDNLACQLVPRVSDVTFFGPKEVTQQEAFITNIDLTNGNERELLDNYWMPSISAGGKSAS